MEALRSMNYNALNNSSNPQEFNLKTYCIIGELCSNLLLGLCATIATVTINPIPAEIQFVIVEMNREYVLN
jgi:hypothetical protein